MTLISNVLETEFDNNEKNIRSFFNICISSAAKWMTISHPLGEVKLAGAVQPQDRVKVAWRPQQSNQINAIGDLTNPI